VRFICQMFPDPIISTMDPPAWEAAAPQTRIREGDLQERDPYVRGGKKNAACMLQERGANNSALCARAKREAVPSPFGALRWETSDEHWSSNRRGQLQGVISTQHSAWISCDCRTPPLRDVSGPPHHRALSLIRAYRHCNLGLLLLLNSTAQNRDHTPLVQVKPSCCVRLTLMPVLVLPSSVQ